PVHVSRLHPLEARADGRPAPDRDDGHAGGPDPAARPVFAGRRASGMIVIAPYSNDALRDWPRAHFERLIDLCLENLDREIVLVGSAEQRQAINLMVRGRPAG